MSFLTGILGSAVNGAVSGLGGALQPAPSQAARNSSDFNPVTLINAPGVPSLSDIGNLLTKINAENAYNGGLSGHLAPTSPLASPYNSGTSMNLILIAAVALVGILIWRKYG